ncbi:hypothetical protein [Ideonella livida]|uniref:Uncharacterized protein n=1 Tax=Ideonella livida TaxID=2707176 RepID=A0A7C9THJ4_9BURK|nr:hypothetical protein [Ideonella livida]NDY89724.1 hypothetical protein [Ideonella livida]
MSLSPVAASLQLSARMITLNHPAAMDCQVYRKSVSRTAHTDAPGETIGGLPLLGGVPVLSDEDEADVDWDPVLPEDQIHAKCLLLGGYSGSSMLDNGQGPDAPALQEARIEPLAAPGSPGYFELSKGDLIMVMPGGGVVFTFAVQDFSNTLMLPPYVPKVILAAQGDLTYIPSVSAAVDNR